MDSIEDTAQISSLVKIADIYGPLNQARNEIRLLQWVSSPGDDDTVVHWRLFTVSLLEQPKYIAFSYVWGDASITENVTINGKTVPVTTSLAAALERVRKSVEIPDSSVFFWADALCINQKDALERNSQVQMMRSIYSKAMMVFSWLGLDEDPASTLYAIYPELWTVHEDSYGKNLFWAAVRKFFQNTYWTRVWILQEMALGKEVWL
ncbi:HET-domain-containing protein, partial [Hyaloscypha variabilis F]